MVRVLLFFGVMSLALAGRSSEQGHDLEAYCGHEACITYDARVASLSRYADYGVQLGTCGRFRVIGIGGGKRGFTEYFDERGDLVSADQNDHFGPRPVCDTD